MFNPGDLVVCIRDISRHGNMMRARGIPIIDPVVGRVYTVRYTRIWELNGKLYLSLVEIVQPISRNSGEEYTVAAKNFRKIVKKDQSFFLGTKAPVDA